MPVQKLATDYYQVEHIIDYVPIEKAETVYVTQPQEVVNMRLQYVPVEQYFILYAEGSYTSSKRTLGCLAFSRVASCSTTGLSQCMNPETCPPRIIHT